MKEPDNAPTEPFRLEQPKPEKHTPPSVENVKTAQKPLFVGADDLPGQRYLFE